MKIICLFILSLSFLSFSASAEQSRCAHLCANNFTILKGNHSPFNFLNFNNFSHRRIGKCRGHAITGQKFSELARFKNSNECLNQSTPKCYKDIREGIRKIVNFKTHTFFGFKSLNDFSSNSRVKVLLMNEIRRISHRYRAVQGSIRDRNHDTEVESIFHELKMRVKEKQQPYIAVLGDTIGGHAVIAYDIAFIEGHEALCIRDSNIIFEDEGERCQNYLYISKGKARYKRIKRQVANLSTFQLMSDEDKRVKKYIAAQFNRCKIINRCI
jgi:hypothetical protein